MTHAKYPLNIHYPPTDCLDMRPAQIALRRRKGCDVNNPCQSYKCTACEVMTSNTTVALYEDLSIFGDGTGFITCLTFSIWPKRFKLKSLDSELNAGTVLVQALFEKAGVAERRWHLCYNLGVEVGCELFVRAHTDPIPQNQWRDLQKNLLRAGKKDRIYLHGNGIANYFFAEALRA